MAISKLELFLTEWSRSYFVFALIFAHFSITVRCLFSSRANCALFAQTWTVSENFSSNYAKAAGKMLSFELRCDMFCKNSKVSGFLRLPEKISSKQWKSKSFANWHFWTLPGAFHYWKSVILSYLTPLITFSVQKICVKNGDFKPDERLKNGRGEGNLLIIYWHKWRVRDFFGMQNLYSKKYEIIWSSNNLP